MTKFELYYPIKPWNILQGWGTNGEWYRANGINILGHNGFDLFADDGQTIRAAHDGIVTFTGEDGKGGLGVVIRTQEEFIYKDGTAFFKSIYWHCKSNTFKVKPGDVVKAGDAIAQADNTGFSTSTHLHFSIKPVAKTGEADWQWYNLEQENGYLGCIDPTPYFNKFYAQDAQLVISILSSIIETYKLIINKLKI